MAFFTAILAHTDSGYRSVDLDVDGADDIDDLSEIMGSVGDGESIAVIEHEDEWFALIRRIDEREVKVFLSDLEAVERSSFADLFSDYLDSPEDEYEEEDFDYDDEGESSDDDEEEQEMLGFEPDSLWGGDPDIFADRGVPAEDLIDQVERYSSDPARVVAHVGEAVGFADQLEAAR